jgi:hypothetical protein
MNSIRGKSIFGVIVLIVFLSGCAQIGTLTGGDKDKEPPILVKSNPSEKSLNFKGNELTLGFDEFIQLENLNAVFFSSPPLTEKPEFKIKRKNLVIKLQGELYDTTTYTFWFGDAIRDFHESNALKNFKFVFSTGNVLDTFEISGKIVDAYTLKAEPEILIMLYNQFKDSIPLLEKPYYAIKSDTAGNFKIDYIKPGKYKLFALKDNDADFLFNLPNEKIAFLDSFVFPKVETETTIDSLKAGSIIHVGDTTAPGDTLKHDSIIVHQEYIYTPKDLKLFLFNEDNQDQYVLNKERETAGKCVFEFFKPVDSFTVEGLNFKLNPETVIIEKNDSATILTYWLKDREIYQRDTLQFIVGYYNKDSLEHIYKETDTISMIFDNKKDTLIQFAEFETLNPEQDSSSGFILSTRTPIEKFLKQGIRLYELSDTLVDDPKIQSLIKAYRPEPDLLQFEIKRPYVHNFFLEPLNIDTLPEWSVVSRNEGRTKLEYRLTNPGTILKDTIKAVLHYDNSYFRNQVQSFSDTIEMPIFKQSLISLQRTEEDLIKMVFKKKISSETTVELINEERDPEFEIISQPVGDELHLKIRNREIFEKDTLLVRIRTKDYDNTKGEKVFYEYEKTAVFIHKKQKLNHFSRIAKEEFVLVFNKPLKEMPKLKLFDLNAENTWYRETINTSRDTLNYKITQKGISVLDTIEIEVSLGEGIPPEKIKLIYKKPPRHKPGNRRNTGTNKDTKIPPGMQSVTIETPLDFTIKKDTSSERKLFITRTWDTGKNYVLKMDTSAIEDIFTNKSKKTEVKFKVRARDYYGSIKINISEIKRISDSDFYVKKDSVVYDSTVYSKLEIGQLIVYLIDKDNITVSENYVNYDSGILFEKLLPGDYSMKLVYDRNMNKKWDTGNYLKKIQPERIVQYPQKINVKSSTETALDIKMTTLE